MKWAKTKYFGCGKLDGLGTDKQQQYQQGSCQKCSGAWAHWTENRQSPPVAVKHVAHPEEKNKQFMAFALANVWHRRAQMFGTLRL